MLPKRLVYLLHWRRTDVVLLRYSIANRNLTTPIPGHSHAAATPTVLDTRDFSRSDNHKITKNHSNRHAVTPTPLAPDGFVSPNPTSNRTRNAKNSPNCHAFTPNPPPRTALFPQTPPPAEPETRKTASTVTPSHPPHPSGRLCFPKPTSSRSRNPKKRPNCDPPSSTSSQKHPFASPTPESGAPFLM